MADKFSAEQMANAVHEARGLKTVAARRLGCTRQTVTNYANRYRAVADAVIDAREAIVDRAESKMFDAIEGGEPWALALTLKTLGRDRGYVERTEQQQSGEVIVRVEYVNSPEPETS